MKRTFYKLTLFCALLAAGLTFTSCDEDHYWDYYDYYEEWYDDYDWYNDKFNYGTDQLTDMAQTLNGCWQGTLTNEYTNDYGHRERVKMNVEFTFVQYDRRSLNGRGYELDWIGNESQNLSFQWYIDPRSGNIHVKYDSGYTFVLDDRGNSEYSGFSLDNDDFSGVMEGVNNDEYLFFVCSRVSRANAAGKNDTTTSGTDTTPKDKAPAYGSANGMARTDSDLPLALRRR